VNLLAFAKPKTNCQKNHVAKLAFFAIIFHEFKKNSLGFHICPMGWVQGQKG
jgi:hypothetical protein